MGAYGVVTFAAETEVFPGEWSFVGLSSNGRTLSFIINDQVTSGQIPVRFAPGAEVLVIGASLSDGEAYFNGLLDEVRIYNCALTPHELLSLSGQSSTSRATGHWADVASGPLTLDRP